MSFNIGPIDSADPSYDAVLLAAIEEAVKDNILDHTGPGIGSEDITVTLSTNGSTIVADVSIIVPEGVAVSNVVTNLNNASNDDAMAENLVENLQTIPQFGSIAGDDLAASISTPEVTAQACILPYHDFAFRDLITPCSGTGPLTHIR